MSKAPLQEAKSRFGVWHVDGPVGQILAMAGWVEGELERADGPNLETLGKVARNLRSAADEVVSRSEAEALAEALGEIKARCDRIAAGEYGGLAAAADMSDIAGRAQGDYRVRHPKETP